MLFQFRDVGKKLVKDHNLQKDGTLVLMLFQFRDVGKKLVKDNNLQKAHLLYRG